MNETVRYFATPGVMTSAGPRAALLDALPQDIGELCRVVQGLMVHIFWAERYGLKLSDKRQQEAAIRPAAAKLERIMELDPRPLVEPRPLKRRLVGNCRDFSVMLTTILRHQGVPARARCGFGRYFRPDHYEDHWVVEYWNADEGRWVLVDAQMDELQRDALGIAFDPLDVPRDQFLTGGAAWQLARGGAADPDAFGIFDLHGLWFIRGNLGRDVAALNKVELLPWDSWGIMEDREADGDPISLTALDEMAALTAGDVADVGRVRALYETDQRWRVPPTIRSYTSKGPILVDLALA